MAIDSREKRAGAAGLAFLTILPLADSEIAQADRQQCAGNYPGILALPPPSIKLCCSIVTKALLSGIVSHIEPANITESPFEEKWLNITGSNLHSFCGGENLAEALDGAEDWGHQADEDHWFIIDLGSSYTLSKVRSRSNYIYDPTFIHIYVSENLVDWGLHIGEGACYDTDEWVEIPFSPPSKTGRYVKVVAVSTEHPQDWLTWGTYPYLTIFDVYGSLVDVGFNIEVANKLHTGPKLNISEIAIQKC